MTKKQSNRRPIFAIIFLILMIIVMSSCFYRAQNSTFSNESAVKKIIQVKLIDSVTEEPIVDGIVFVLVAKDSDLGPHEEVKCLGPYKIKEDGYFRYKTRRSFKLFEFWFLAPGYKSIPIQYTKNWEPLILLPILGSREGDAIAALLFTMIGETEIRTDFKEGITTIPLQSLKENPALWEKELTIGLYPLKSVAPTEELNRFIVNELQELEEMKKLSKNR